MQEKILKALLKFVLICTLAGSALMIVAGIA
jgi:hypothetical protein